MTDEPAGWIDVEQRMHTPVPFRGRIVAESLDRDRAHARHDSHAEHDVNRISDFKTDFGKRRITRSHDVGNDEHGPSAHRTFQKPMKFCISFPRLRPIISRAGFLFRRRANECELLDARDVVWVRTMQIGTRNVLIVQFDQHIVTRRLFEQEVLFALGAIAPKNILRLRQSGDVLHPIKDRLIRRLGIADSIGRQNSGRDIFHERKNVR